MKKNDKTIKNKADLKFFTATASGLLFVPDYILSDKRLKIKPR